jgi:hypothetical protein
VSGSNIRNQTRQQVNSITPHTEHVAISVSIAMIHAHTKTALRVPIAVPLDRASTEAITSILI